MPAPAPAFFGTMDDQLPKGTDSRTISDNTHRNIITTMNQQCPNWIGPVTATHNDVNVLTGLAAAGAKALPGQPGLTTMIFYSPTIPFGWTLAPPDGEVRALTIGEGVGGNIGGNTSPTDYTHDLNTTVATTVTVSTVSVNLPARTADHTLDINEMPAHVHTQRGVENESLGNPLQVELHPAIGGQVVSAATVTDPIGGGLPHSHDIGGTASGTGSGTGAGTGTGTLRIQPRYANCQIAFLSL